MQSLENNRRIQTQNNAPLDFPAFVRQGYDIKIMADGYDRDEKGLIYKVRQYNVLPGWCKPTVLRAPVQM